MADFKQLLAEQQRTTEALQKMEGTVQQGNKQNFIGLNTQAINQKRSEAAKVREAKKREGGQKKQTGLLATLIALGKDAKKSRVAQAAGRLTGAAKSAAKRASATANALSESIGKLRDDFRDGFEKLIPGGKDTVALLKKGLIAGAVTALIALVDTPTFKKIEDFVFEKFLPGLVTVYENFIKPIGIFFFETFAEALNRILDFALDPSWETFKNIFQLDMPTALTVLLGAFAIFKTAAFLKSPVMLAASAIALPFKAGGFIVKSLGSLTSSFLSFQTKSTKEGFNLLQKEFSGIGTKISKLGSTIGKDVKEMILDPITNGATKLKTRVGDIGKTIGSAGKKTLLKLPMATFLTDGFKSLNKTLKEYGDSIGKKGKGSLKAIKGFGDKLFGATKGLGKLAGGVGRVAVGAAKFAGPVGAVLTAGMAAFDGVSAGITEFKESGSLGSAVKEGFAGAVSGLTFGLVDQETISGGMSKIGEKGKEVFKSVTDSIFGGIKSLGKTIMSFFTGDFEFPDFDLKSLNPFSGLVDKIKNQSSISDYKNRMLNCIQDQKKFGVTALLSFIDIDDVAGFRAIDAAYEIKQELDFNFKIACQTLKGVLTPKYEMMIEFQMSKIDIIGSLPSADCDKSKHLDRVMRWAKVYNKRLHVHVDQLNTADEKETELLARKTMEWGLEDKVTAVHSISLACHPRKYRNEVYKMSRDAGLSFISCPSAWIDHPRREDFAPIHNSITPVDELIENNLTVAIGSDNIMDVYKPYCDGDMSFELRMLLEACKIYNEEELVKIATTNGRKVLGIF